LPVYSENSLFGAGKWAFDAKMSIILLKNCTKTRFHAQLSLF